MDREELKKELKRNRLTLPELEIFLSNLPYKRFGSVFQYKSPVNLRFFTRAQIRLKFNKIYTVHQIRKTFATKLIEKVVFQLQGLVKK